MWLCEVGEDLCSVTHFDDDIFFDDDDVTILSDNEVMPLDDKAVLIRLLSKDSGRD